MAFVKLTSNSEHFEKKDEAHSSCISEIKTFEKRGCLTVLKASFCNTRQQLTC